MAKIWGFLVSALLVGLCLCLDIRTFPNVIGDENSSGQAATQRVDDATGSEPIELQKTDESAPDDEQNAAPEPSRDDSTYAQVGGARSLTKTPERFNWEQASHRVENAASSSAVIVKSNAKPQGGKYVSIPSVEMDALPPSETVNARVVGAHTAPEMPSYSDN